MHAMYGQHAFVDYRWLGGILYEFPYMRTRMKRLEELDNITSIRERETRNSKKMQSKLLRRASQDARKKSTDCGY